jgi:hypothetical protein
LAVVQNVGLLHIKDLRSARRIGAMWPKWLTSVLLLMEAWSARRDAHIRFLKAQIETLQSRLPGIARIIVARMLLRSLFKMLKDKVRFNQVAAA